MQAPDAHHALAMIATPSRIDLLFTDVVMPDVNGRQLAEQGGGRGRISGCSTRRLYPRRDRPQRTLEPGVDLLPKPFTIEQLARKVRDVLDRGE